MKNNTDELKVLYILHEKNPAGATLSFLDFIGEISDYIIPTVVIPEDGPVNSMLREKGLKVYIVPFALDFIRKTDIPNTLQLITDNDLAAKTIAEIIKKENIQLVHSNTSVENVGILSAIYADVPHVWHIRELVERQFERKYSDYELKRKLFASSDLLIAISKCVKRDIECKYELKTVQLYDAIECSTSENGMKKNGNTFLFLGSISKNKGQWDAVRAVKVLSDRGINVKLIIAGAYNYKTLWTINRYIKDNHLEQLIEIKDFVDDPSELRMKSGFAIIGSEYEALGRVTIEAMLAGNIPIGVNNGETKELIGSQEKRGFLYEFGNYEQLAETMIKAINLSVKKQNEIRREMKLFAELEFSSVVYVKRLVDIYINVVRKGFNKVNRKEICGYINEELKKKNSIDFMEQNKKNTGVVNRHEYISRIENILNENGIENVAIYGMARLGCELYDFLKKNGYVITAVFERSPDILGDIIDISSIGSAISEDTQLIILTVVRNNNMVKKELSDIYNIPIITVNDVLKNEENEK